MHPDRWATPNVARYALRDAGRADSVTARFWGGETPISIPIGELPPQPSFPWVIHYRRAGRGYDPNALTALVRRNEPHPIDALRSAAEPIEILGFVPQAAVQYAPTDSSIGFWQSTTVEPPTDAIPVAACGITETGRVFFTQPQGADRLSYDYIDSLL